MPDIHGRTFWKDAVKKFPKEQCPDLNIVFLGDYLDPYESYDKISKEQAYQNFIEILDYAHNDDRVILLIGNHDWHYFVSLDTCRLDMKRYDLIRSLFVDNDTQKLFRLTYQTEINNQKYLFSHAGITMSWLRDVAQLASIRLTNMEKSGIDDKDTLKVAQYEWTKEIANINKTYNFELFEECLKKYNDMYYNYYPSMISSYRGGRDRSGSLIWADVHEHLDFFREPLPGYYQIFGHTISYPDYNPKAFYIDEYIAMLDASCAFILDVEGNISPIQ